MKSILRTKKGGEYTFKHVKFIILEQTKKIKEPEQKQIIAPFISYPFLLTKIIN